MLTAKRYLRIGCTYYKIINGSYLKKWKRATIIFDYGKLFVNDVPKYDDFDCLPENLKSLEVR